MTPALYQNMVRYAKRVMPFHSYQEPMDLVNEAYLAAGGDNVDLLKKKILGLAYQDKSYMACRAPFVEYKAKNRRIIETSKICKVCQVEKGFSNFRSKNSKVLGGFYYLNTCKTCEGKKDLARYREAMANPEKAAVIRERKRACDKKNREKNREKMRENWRAYYEKIKSDPVKYEARKESKRISDRKRYSLVKFIHTDVRHNVDHEQKPLIIMSNNDQESNELNKDKEQPEGWMILRHKIKIKLNNSRKYEAVKNDPDKIKRKKERDKINWQRRKERINNDPILLERSRQKSREYQQKKNQINREKTLQKQLKATPKLKKAKKHTKKDSILNAFTNIRFGSEE